jgi:hypothetical protein
MENDHPLETRKEIASGFKPDSDEECDHVGSEAFLIRLFGAEELARIHKIADGGFGPSESGSPNQKAHDSDD